MSGFQAIELINDDNMTLERFKVEYQQVWGYFAADKVQQSSSLSDEQWLLSDSEANSCRYNVDDALAQFAEYLTRAFTLSGKKEQTAKDIRYYNALIATYNFTQSPQNEKETADFSAYIDAQTVTEGEFVKHLFNQMKRIRDSVAKFNSHVNDLVTEIESLKAKDRTPKALASIDALMTHLRTVRENSNLSHYQKTKIAKVYEVTRNVLTEQNENNIFNFNRIAAQLSEASNNNWLFVTSILMMAVGVALIAVGVHSIVLSAGLATPIGVGASMAGAGLFAAAWGGYMAKSTANSHHICHLSASRGEDRRISNAMATVKNAIKLRT